MLFSNIKRHPEIGFQSFGAELRPSAPSTKWSICEVMILWDFETEAGFGLIPLEFNAENFFVDLDNRTLGLIS